MLLLLFTMQKKVSWDPSIPEDLVLQAYLRRAGRLYSYFSHNQRAEGRLKKKKLDERALEGFRQVITLYTFTNCSVN